MNIHRVAAFCDGRRGGNPAGVVVVPELPPPEVMQTTARSVGFSETVFAQKGTDGWKVRYFSPAAEIPFCGHATIALAAFIASQEGDGSFRMLLAHDSIEVEAQRREEVLGVATFHSPPSSSRATTEEELTAALRLFGLRPQQLHPSLRSAVISAGSTHLLLPLGDRHTLAAMDYDFATGQRVMTEHGWVTVLLAYPEHDALFHVRNAFAFGGVHEDPATGAAAAALAGYLRQHGYGGNRRIDVRQGEDMGVPCHLTAYTPESVGGRARVAGAARLMSADEESRGQGAAA